MRGLLYRFFHWTPRPLSRSSSGSCRARDLLARDGVAHNNLFAHPVLEENKSMAAIEQIIMVPVAAASKGEACTRDVIGRVQDGGEHDLLFGMLEEAE